MKRFTQLAASAARSTAFTSLLVVLAAAAAFAYGVPAYLAGSARDEAARVASVPERDFRLSDTVINYWDDTLDIPTSAGDVVRLPLTHPYAQKLFDAIDSGDLPPATERVRLRQTDEPQFAPMKDDDRADTTRYGTWLAVEPLEGAPAGRSTHSAVAGV